MPKSKEKKNKAAKKAEIVKPAPQMMSKSDAQKTQAEIISDLKSADHCLVSAALKLDKFVRGKGWVALGYKNMNDWREKEIDFADFYNLRNVQYLLAEGVPAEAIEKMPLTNINTMARQLPPSKWVEKSWQKAAIELPVARFTEQAQAAGEKIGMHVEVEVRRGFSVSKSIADNWDLALKVAELIEGANTMDARIDALAANYLTSPSPEAGKNKLQYYEETIHPKEEAAAF
jgi:hypothetical protein